MEKKSWVLICFFCVFFIQSVDIQAQKIQKKISIVWTENVKQYISEDNFREFLHFEGSAYFRNEDALPVFFEKIPVDNLFSEYQVTTADVHYEPMGAHDQSLVPASFPASLQIEVSTAHERNQAYVLVSFVPIVRSGASQCSRITELTVNIEGSKPAHAKSSKSHATRSVLASGQWFKFAVAKTGIYKVTYKDLIDMGMGTPIVSSQIALFGNGGKMLPESNAEPRSDDLRELPVMMHDGGDNSFDEGDYFVFYGESPHTTFYDTLSNHFTHLFNIYSDSTYYFITSSTGVGEKKRVQTVDNSSLQANRTVSDYTHFDFYEEDLYNFGNSGKDWFGDLFDVTTQRAYSFQVPGHKQASSRLSLYVAGVTNSIALMDVAVNRMDLGSMSVSSINSSSMASLNKQDFTFVPNSDNLTVSLTFNKPLTTSTAYLNWIEIEVPCNLSMHSAQFGFSNPSTAGPDNITQFNISGASTGTNVWDVTDPGETFRYALNTTNGQASFKAPTDIIRQFYAFDGSSYLSITPIGSVVNQNLHATGATDMVIVSHPNFLAQANKLADFRRSNDGLTVKVVTTEQVYNEFSGGSLDPMAIRDYLKLIYDRTDKASPRYLLLVGRPSYDYRGRHEGTQLFVPNYQYYADGRTITEYNFYSNDDNFGVLDDEETAGLSGQYDVAVGRIPCSTVAQAETAVRKSITYTEKRNLLAEGSTQISNFGDWRNMVAFVADDEQLEFVLDAEELCSITENHNKKVNFDKIYLDAFQQVSNAGGQRYPDATTAINNRMNQGCLMMTYIGHSGKDGWAAERVLENSDISKWSNQYNLSTLLSLSCTFGYYDRPALSPAELAMFNNGGGTSSVVCATRESWSGPNIDYGRHIFNRLFGMDSGTTPTAGELNIYAKNKKGGCSNTNLAMYVVMGDPSMPLAMPRYHLVTDSVNHRAVSAQPDTIRALSKVTVSGRVVDDNMQTLNNFNGTVFPSVYDKKNKTSTLGNDPSSPVYDFHVQKSVLFRGNNTVKNGHFTFTFYVPKDIDYSFGNGKISYYARSTDNDAAGAFSDFIIGGTDTNGLNDKEGPIIDLYMNDENFVDGGIVGPNPTLIAKIKDNYGINTTGNGIGHDLTAILDNTSDAQIILNDYYETEKDSFNMGTVRYNLSELPVGQHTIKVRAWDINNNPSESELSFEVLSDQKLELSHVLNYPNPFTTHTEFFFEQNQNGGMFDIQVQIYTISGKLVKTINTSQYMEGNRCAGIPWDGLDDYGDKIGKGVYMYKVRVRNANNEIAEKIEKLVIL